MITARDNRHVGWRLRLIVWRKPLACARRSAVLVDASPPAGNTRRPAVSASRRGAPDATFAPEPTVPASESRDQLVVRRRAAQRAWRAACERTEQASRHLHEALDTPLYSTAAKARERLEHAQRAERRARFSYYRAAEEIGVLLSRLERTHTGLA